MGNPTTETGRDAARAWYLAIAFCLKCAISLKVKMRQWGIINYLSIFTLIALCQMAG